MPNENDSLFKRMDLNAHARMLSRLRKKTDLTKFRLEKLLSPKTEKHIENAIRELVRLEPGIESTDVVKIIFWNYLSYPRWIRDVIENVKKGLLTDKQT